MCAKKNHQGISPPSAGNDMSVIGPFIQFHIVIQPVRYDYHLFMGKNILAVVTLLTT